MAWATVSGRTVKAASVRSRVRTVTSLVRLSIRAWLTRASTGVTKSTQWAESAGVSTGTLTTSRRRRPRTGA